MKKYSIGFIVIEITVFRNMKTVYMGLLIYEKKDFLYFLGRQH